MLFQGGQLLSDAGSASTAVAYPLLVLVLTGSPARAGIVGFARTLPLALLAIPAGVLADRWNRKWVMVGADVIRAGAVGVLAALIAAGHASFWVLPVVAFVEGAGNAMFLAAQAGALRAIVPLPQLPEAMSSLDGREAAVRLAGPPLGGALFAVANVLPFAVDAASYLFSTGSLLAIRAPFQQSAERNRGSLRARAAEGLRYLWKQRFLRTCALLFGLTNFIVPGLLLAVVVLAHRRHLSGGEVGLLVASFGASVLVGAMIASSIRRALPVRGVLLLELWTYLGSAVFLFWPNVFVLAASLVPAGLAIPASDSVVHAYRIAMTPDRLLSRSESVRSTLSLAIAPFGPLLAGYLLSVTTPRITVSVFVAVSAVLAGWATLSPSIRSAPRLDEVFNAGGTGDPPLQAC